MSRIYSQKVYSSSRLTTSAANQHLPVGAAGARWGHETEQVPARLGRAARQPRAQQLRVSVRGWGGCRGRGGAGGLVRDDDGGTDRTGPRSSRAHRKAQEARVADNIRLCDAANPRTSLRHNQFCVGLEFWCGSRRWRCTDVGSRVIVAISLEPHEIVECRRIAGGHGEFRIRRFEATAEDWLNGPPYAVVEDVFDEHSMQGCSLMSETDDRERA